MKGNDMDQMRQIAPDPTALRDLVKEITYKPGWVFWLGDDDRGQGSEGLTLIIKTNTRESNDPTRYTQVNHLFIVPAAAYDERSWRWWLFEQILLVERHEAAEFFRIDGVRVYAPLHGPGSDPYMVTERRSDVEERTTFRGEVVYG